VPSDPSRNITEDWFRASEAAGDFMGIRYGHVLREACEPEWRILSHCECDGIGGFARVLREKGFPIPRLPETPHSNRGVIGPLWRRWRDGANQAELATRPDWLPAHPPPKPWPDDVAWHLFTHAETTDILAHCREREVTVNSALLHTLDQTVRPEIRDPRMAIPWLIPVNLRHNLRNAGVTRNHVSGIDVPVLADDTTAAIHRRVRHRLERGEHRANHLMLSLGVVLSHRTKVRLIRKSRTKPAGNIGSFSNLGVWDPAGPSGDGAGWVFCPPIVSGQLLAAGCVTFRGRLGLAIQGIPAAATSAQRMEEWVRRIRTFHSEWP